MTNARNTPLTALLIAAPAVTSGTRYQSDTPSGTRASNQPDYCIIHQLHRRMKSKPADNLAVQRLVARPIQPGNAHSDSSQVIMFDPSHIYCLTGYRIQHR